MKSLRLEVDKDNKRALEYYKKNNFSKESLKTGKESFYLKRWI